MGLRPRRLERLSAEITVGTSAPNVIEIRGVLREPDVGTWMMPFIEEVHAAALAQGLGEVQLDIRGLTYANATFWRCLLGWLKLARDAPEGSYTLHILTDPGQRWQLMGMPSLRLFGKQKLVVD